MRNATSSHLLKSLSPKLPAALTLLTALTMWYPAPATAEDFGGSMFSFNGFGTVGVVNSSDDKADFVASLLEPNGAGYSRSWSASVDSLIGAQVTANLTPQLTAVLQLIVQQNYDKTYWPRVEWANIKYQFTPDFDLRIGRMVLPTFLVSDSRKVGYSNPWVRPPVEVYSLNPIAALDGVEASYRLHLGEVTNTLQSSYGRNVSIQFPAGAHVDAPYQWGIFNDTEYGAALLHLSYVLSPITLNSASTAALFDAFRLFGPQGAAVAEDFEVVDKSVTVLTIAGSYDPGQWFAMGEWIRTRCECFIGVTTGWYVSGGYRVGAFTPYLTYAQVTERTTSAPGLSLSAVPAYLAPTVAALNAGLNELLASRPVQYTSSMGVRWDFMKIFDLKVQLDRMNLGAGSTGTLLNIQPGFQPGSTVYLFSTAVDFVF
jgi:hypothetical protein